MDEDEVLSKITRLLEHGCTMLASHHDCGAPLFRCQGEIVCPVCSFEEPLSASERAGTDVVRSEEKGRSDTDRAQSPQMHKTGMPSGREGGQDLSVEGPRPDQSTGEDVSGRSVEELRPGQSTGEDVSSRSVEELRPDQSTGGDASGRSIKRDRSDGQMEGYLSIQDDLQLLSAKDDLRSAILLRLKELTASLRAEQDLDKLRRILDCLEALLRTLRSLSE